MSRTRRLSTTVRNCTRDEGGPFEAGSQVQVSSHRKLLSSRATGGSGQSAALTAERVSAFLWRISPLAVSDEGCDESDLVRVGNAAAFATAGERSRTPPDIIPKPSAQRSACSPLARAGARIERVRAECSPKGKPASGLRRQGWSESRGILSAKGLCAIRVRV